MGGWEVGEDGEHGQDGGAMMLAVLLFVGLAHVSMLVESMGGREDEWVDGRMGGWVAWMCAMMLAVLLFVGRAHVGVDSCCTGTCIDVG